MSFIRRIPLSADGMFYDPTFAIRHNFGTRTKSVRRYKEPGITSTRSLTLVCSITLYDGQKHVCPFRSKCRPQVLWHNPKVHRKGTSANSPIHPGTYFSKSPYSSEDIRKTKSEIHRLIDDQKAAVRQLLDNCAVYGALRTPPVLRP